MTYLYQDGKAYPILIGPNGLFGQSPREFQPYHYGCTSLDEKVALARLGIEARLVEQKEEEQ